jgi:hypothetical protein
MTSVLKGVHRTGLDPNTARQLRLGQMPHTPQRPDPLSNRRARDGVTGFALSRGIHVNMYASKTVFMST